MNSYKRPVVTIDKGLAEGIYAASGALAVNCDSKYMLGEWQAPDYSDWNGITRGYKQQFGCQGCPAYRWNGCGMKLDYNASGNAGSYDTDKGNRIPTWEKKEYGPNDPVTDWNM